MPLHLHVLPFVKKFIAVVTKGVAPFVSVATKLRKEFAPDRAEMEAVRTDLSSASASVITFLEEGRRKLQGVIDQENEILKRLSIVRRERARLSKELRSAEDQRVAIPLAHEGPTSTSSILTGERRAYMRETVEATAKLNNIAGSVTACGQQAHQWRRSLETTLEHFALPPYMAKQWQDILKTADTSTLEEELKTYGQPVRHDTSQEKHKTTA